MNITALFFIFLTFFLSSTIFIAWMHHQYTPLPTIKSPHSSSSTSLGTSTTDIFHDHSSKDVSDVITEHEKDSISTHPSNPILEAHLSCNTYGGPDDDVAQKMVYWSDIPKDAQFVSPYKKLNTPQYLVFEPDVSVTFCYLLHTVAFLYGCRTLFIFYILWTCIVL